ncbi:hypothetical protein PILCRDRAFT_1868 [Piloderma croceum F 1598]|uniref:NACHT domain-containing protein n=1 Tax=Piloderma croceum (strain F 1598) TaxID=765440 RepID=A0A0C3GG24_PILCF|nr:hypothetical protein PILCRDRAFT_1868 [Piloderma croceum F 1598]
MSITEASDAAGLNIGEAIAQGKDVLPRMKLMPSMFQRIRGATDVSGTVTNNIKPLSAVWGPLLQNIKIFIELVDEIAEVHPYAKMAWNILSASYKIIVAQTDRDDCITRLVEVMDDIYLFVQEAEPVKKIKSHGRIVALMAQQTTECAYFIRDYATNKNFWKRALNDSFMSTVDSKIKQYEDKFKELKLAFQDHTILQTRITVSRIMGDLESLALDFDLSGVHYAEGARFYPEKGCLPGTRKEIIDEITQWINSPNGDAISRIFFLSGVAGSGKSAIAHTIAQLFDQQRRLGSSYCFDRADQVNRRPSNLLSTIALNIADLDPQWKTSLARVVEGNRSLRTTLSTTEQFHKLLLEPAKALTIVGPVVVVIDALDESAEESSRKALRDILAKGISDLPSNFQILITARPEPDIVNAFNGNRHIFCKHMSDIAETSNEADITMLIETQLSSIRSLELQWPNKHWCRMLVQSSDGLFQWASTACRVIKDIRNRKLTPNRMPEPLHVISARAGCPILGIGDGQNTGDQGATAHSELRGDGDPPDLVELVVQFLGSLLSGVNQEDVPVRALHASFLDFLSDESRSKSYYVSPSQHNSSLALSSLRVMKSGLRFNICGLETSHCRNTDVLDLTTRIKKNILPHLSDFFHHRFLYWLEVLSLIKGINLAAKILRSILEWNKDKNDDIASFANDAIKFVSVFGPPISQSVPHIYLSGLPFAPMKSEVAQHYLPIFPKTLQLKTGKAYYWPSIIGVFEGHIKWVRSVAFSQHGRHIVSGSDDKTIRVWDAETGDVVVGPLQGHTDKVNSVAFSQDGRRIVSGSNDETIRVWDAETGDVVAGPLQGHTDKVNSVAFSQDGKYIISGSGNQTIRVWNAETGDVVASPLQGHTNKVNSVAFSQDGPLRGHVNWVNSVAFSQDGRRIVSGSGDQTIRVWNAETGDLVVDPLQGHTNSVTSVTFSQDGKRTVSGSNDKTIRVWDAETGDLIVRPLRGHTDRVNSVTIRVWNAETGDVVAGPLQGHTGEITSVAFSQDDRHIVSSSYDKTICVWDAETGDIVAGPLQGHTDKVNSVAFSQDGRHIVSGSGDGTIYVWDAETGDIIAEPIQRQSVSGMQRLETLLQDGRRIVSGSDDQTIRVWDAHVVSDSGDATTNGIFKDSSRLEDGWILSNSSSELLFWVPSWNRTGLCWPRNPFVIDGGADESTQLDLGDFVHDGSWEQCKA